MMVRRGWWGVFVVFVVVIVRVWCCVFGARRGWQRRQVVHLGLAFLLGDGVALVIWQVVLVGAYCKVGSVVFCMWVGSGTGGVAGLVVVRRVVFCMLVCAGVGFVVGLDVVSWF